MLSRRGFGVLGTAAALSWQAAEAAPRYTVNRVTARQTRFAGREATQVELAPEVQQAILAGTPGASNGPTYAVLEEQLSDGVIEADIAAVINGRGAPDARGFAGLAFHLSPDAQTFEAVYLRMANGALNVPPPPAPRDVRAVQYVAHPDFHFAVSRERFPGRYEHAAPIALGRWHRLRLEIAGPRLRAKVDGAEILAVDDLRYAGRKGRVGLWVDDGSTAYFANVWVRPA